MGFEGESGDLGISFTRYTIVLEYLASGGIYLNSRGTEGHPLSQYSIVKADTKVINTSHRILKSENHSQSSDSSFIFRLPLPLTNHHHECLLLPSFLFLLSLLLSKPGISPSTREQPARLPRQSLLTAIARP